MGDGLLSLNWNNHGATFCHTLAALRGKDKYTDVTVSCEGNFYQVHKLVLSTCSEYFEKIFENTPCKHPVIVLRDVQCDELESLLNYMYKGVVSVAQSDLSRLIKVAELLQIKGLAVPDEPPTTSKSGSGKRSNEDRLSPRSSSDSPYPKRRRRRESDNYQASSSHSRNNDVHEASVSEDRDNRVLEDRLYDLPQEPLRSPVTVNVDETLVKEEILDNDDENEVPETDYGGIGDHSGDGSQDALGLMIPKFDDTKDGDAGPSPVTLPDPVVEALAGPSGLQGWADGGDMTRRMSLGEGYASGDSQDMSSSVGLPTQASGQPPQMEELLYEDHFLVLREIGNAVDSVVKKKERRRKKDEGDANGAKRKERCGKKDEGDANAVKKPCEVKKKENRRKRDRPPGERKKPRCNEARAAVLRLRNPGIEIKVTDEGHIVFHCPNCKFFTKHLKYLKVHINNHLRPTTYKNLGKFTCKFCHERFPVESYMLRHIRKHHGDEELTGN